MADDPSASTLPLLANGIKLRERWEILKKIGGGGFGEIYKARDNSTGQVRNLFFFNILLLLLHFPDMCCQSGIKHQL